MAIVQVRPADVVVQFGEPLATFATIGVATPPMATEIDAVDGERNCRCARAAVFGCAGNVSASVPLSYFGPEVPFVIAPPEHAGNRSPANNAQLLALRRANSA
jgi:hypothetical protein